MFTRSHPNEIMYKNDGSVHRFHSLLLYSYGVTLSDQTGIPDTISNQIQGHDLIWINLGVCNAKKIENHRLPQLIYTTTEFKLCMDREGLPERGILQWKRKKSASALKVVYIGEAGIDPGALRKEFLTGKLVI